MASGDRLFVLDVAPAEVDQILRRGMTGFDTFVPRRAASPARGRLTLLVRSSSPWQVVGLAVAESGGSRGSFHRRVIARAIKIFEDDRLTETALRRTLTGRAFEVLADAVRGQATELTEAASRPIFHQLASVACRK
jgi:hypothetical protein